MVKSRIDSLKGASFRSFKGLLPWLALVTLVIGSLYIFGSLALVWPRYDQAIDTRSRLLADYKAWLYDTIPAINIEALVQDILTEKNRAGTAEPTLVQGVFLVPQATTPAGIGLVTPAPVSTLKPIPTQTQTLPPLATLTSVPSSTPLPPTVTLLPTPTKTRTPTPTSTRAPILPTRTNTPVPPHTATPRPPTPTATTVPPTRTSTTRPPTATFTPTRQTPSVTPVTIPPSNATATQKPTAIVASPTLAIAPSPTPAIVHPIAENDGNSVMVGGGCLASFGYLNDNPQVLDIPVGSANHLSINTVSPPTKFLVGRMYDVLQVTWDGPGDLIWYLNGQTATVKWCK